MNPESRLQAKLLLEAPKRFADLRLFRRNIGSATMRGGYTVAFGIPGQCDLYGVTRGGRHLEIELKSVGKRVAPGSDQDNWANWCAEWGIPYAVLTAKKNETDDEVIDRWCNEIALMLGQLDP
jgi:hypothetical protein